MLGDTGSNLVGALAGLMLVLTLSETGQLIALGLLLAITLYGELRSISALILKFSSLLIASLISCANFSATAVKVHYHLVARVFKNLLWCRRHGITDSCPPLA